jgi:hypothetical protein
VGAIDAGARVQTSWHDRSLSDPHPFHHITPVGRCLVLHPVIRESSAYAPNAKGHGSVYLDHLQCQETAGYYWKGVCLPPRRKVAPPEHPSPAKLSRRHLVRLIYRRKQPSQGVPLRLSNHVVISFRLAHVAGRTLAAQLEIESYGRHGTACPNQEIYFMGRDADSSLLDNRNIMLCMPMVRVDQFTCAVRNQATTQPLLPIHLYAHVACTCTKDARSTSLTLWLRSHVMACCDSS